MFRRFWPAKWVYGNRRHWCSFKATINLLIWNDVELVGLQNGYLDFSKFWKFWEKKKIPKMSIFFFSRQFPPNQNLQKNITYVRGQCLMNMCTKFYVDIFKNSWDIAQNMSKRALFTSFRDFTVIFLILFFDRFWRFKKCFRLIFAFFAKICHKNMYRSLNLDFFVWPFSPGDLRWPWAVLWSQSTGTDTYRCQWHYPCRFIGFVCA